MKFEIFRMTYTTYSFDMKMFLGGLTIYVFPLVKFYKINRKIQLAVGWLCWGLVFEWNPYKS